MGCCLKEVGTVLYIIFVFHLSSPNTLWLDAQMNRMWIVFVVSENVLKPFFLKQISYGFAYVMGNVPARVEG